MLPQLVVSGLAQGVVYALVALSMTMVYRATTVVNFGHGDLVMGGAFLVYVLVVYARLPYVVGGLLAVAGLFAVGVAIQQGLMRRITGGPHLAIAMMALAVGYALRGGARLLWGREVLPFPRIFPDRAWMFNDVVVTSDNVVVSGTVLVLLAALFVLGPVIALYELASGRRAAWYRPFLFSPGLARAAAAFVALYHVARCGVWLADGTLAREFFAGSLAGAAWRVARRGLGLES